MKFSDIKGIKANLVEILNENKYIELKPIQEKVLKLNCDLMIQAPTGSGKTLCYVIPIVNFLQTRMNGVKAVIIVPTRELCLQIQDVFRMFKVDCDVFIGGKDTETEEIKFKTNVILGTPGKLHSIFKSKQKELNKVKYLILDEADKLLSQGFVTQLKNIIGCVNKERRVIQFYTATINDSVKTFSRQIGNFKEISIENEIPEELKISYTIVERPNDKIGIVFDLFKKNKKIILFCCTCAEVDYFYAFINEICNGRKIYKLHGKIVQTERNEIFKNIMTDSEYILITTDLSARGYDFKHVDIVIHFDVPKDYANVLHRSGRSGRNGEEGKSLLLLMKIEMSYINFLKLKYEKLSLKEESYKVSEIHKNNVDVKLKSLAFVSYIRAYKEHILSYILNYKQLNLDEIKDVFDLDKMPVLKDYSYVKKRFKKKG